MEDGGTIRYTTLNTPVVDDKGFLFWLDVGLVSFLFVF
jgi:hypothetical protein